MAPMNWTLLFTIFISLYLVSLIFIYFTSSNTASEDSIKNSSNHLDSGKLTWKW